MKEAIVDLCDRILYSDLAEIGYDVGKLEQHRQKFVEFMHTMCRGCEGKYTAKTASKRTKQRTLTKDERDKFYIDTLVDEITKIADPEDKARVVSRLINNI
tara:strand:+ start:205 stop:507 length:303 start_codon:yes stop_codon:yes gene_type:complete